MISDRERGRRREGESGEEEGGREWGGRDRKEEGSEDGWVETGQ